MEDMQATLNFRIKTVSIATVSLTFNCCCQSSWAMDSAVTQRLPRGQDDEEAMLQDLGVHENKSNIKNTSNTNTTKIMIYSGRGNPCHRKMHF